MAILIKVLLSTLFITTPWVVYFFGFVDYYSDYVKSKFQSELQPHNSVYDFIVVGTGSGGLPCALRLSTNKNFKVLILEAGGSPHPLNHIPGLAMDLLGHESTDWNHKTVPQKNAMLGFNNKQSNWNAGKVLGGSTTLNYLMYLRGHPKDYDNWANITGDDEWSYKKVLPFFTKSIKSYQGRYQNNRKNYAESEYGFLQIETRAWTPLYDEFIAAGKEFGFPEIDVNGGDQKTGFGPIEATQKKGERFGTYASILPTLEKRPNVHISKFSQVLKVKFDKNMRAEGVWYLHHGVKKFATASKEVILSAGSINSPKILMHSGVGPQKHLKSVGIKTKLDLPVGENLHDHILVPLMPFLLDKPVSFLPDRDFLPSVFTDYLMNGKGPLTTPTAVHSQIFYSSAKVKKTGDWPDIQCFFSPAGVFGTLTDSFIRALNYRVDHLKPPVDAFIGSDALVLLPGLVRPKSRGSVTLKSRNPLDSPLIDPRYFEHKDDMEAFVDGIKTVIKIFEDSKAFKALNARFGPIPIPGCEAHKQRTDAYWECYARHWATTIWHPAGTNKMGRSKGDKTAVVDSKLRVLKTIGLRIVDASIIPVIPNANTMAPTMMIGEKGAEFIREYWSKQFLVSDRIDRLLLKNQRKYQKCYYSQLT